MVQLSDLTDKYKTQFKVTHSTSRVADHYVFANNELDLSDIQVYGFDYDYTLAVYKESLNYLIYDLGRNVLIDKYKYPKDISQLDYIPDFAIRGLHYDVEHGLLMKIDSFHLIQLGSVYKGLTPVDDEEVLSIYNGSYVPRKIIRSTEGEQIRMKQLNDLFSVPEICLLSKVTDYFIKNNITYHPEIIFNDVQNAVQSIHPVIHKMLNDQMIGQYLERHDSLITFLNRLKENKKKMFLITNSPFKFVDCGMKYMIGNDWIQLFDVIIVQAGKPKFFNLKHKPFRLYDMNNDCQLWGKVSALEKGQIYMEGTVHHMLEMTGWKGNTILYFGDQIYNDLADITLNHGWRTGAIIAELEREIQTFNTQEFRETVSTLQALQLLIDESHKTNDSILLDELIQQRDIMRARSKALFNPQFGSIFRTHHNPTYFSRRLFRYSDIYMSSLTNLCHYSLNHIFCPRRGLLPHETHVCQVNIDEEIKDNLQKF
ncbi:5'-nucleotidase domain-containing protein 3-like [Oppia nitens]|uniref:5'-nucleotidase domain-containing protein 3-like n=1 Tax=Oppia nitens TaxID=1686743 RepID=UPI0023DB35FB|nr:5'-nucleotidase domain-containing protein 3-like [Oppia nitens]